MNAITVAPYDAMMKQAWNAFNRDAVNGHFLFDRNFMEYHADRFDDASLVLLKQGVVAGIFPASRAGTHLYSHQGLTFGGLVHSQDLRIDEVLEMFNALGEHAKEMGVDSIVYKAMPTIYNRAPAEGSIYALFRNDAICRRRDTSATIDYRAPGQRSRRRARALRKSQAADLQLVWDKDGWEEYWQVLAEVLARRHSRSPVHTCSEIRMLADRFPDNIKLFVAKKDDATVAGVVMFETEHVAHAQYIAAGSRGQELAALDAIFDHLIGHYAGSKRYFDFGISTEQEGRHLNTGLADYKHEWGAGCVVYDTYQWPLSSWPSTKSGY
ncbi:GNAT family N-acetyltransferase [Rhizobium terrae]|uniref:GNAT family N-acetyltransferase n=1 Tax=Rhizobium terrae TaxID=2171756 RepID=UPI000E3E156D|nr:GNAT family N-acetyltransferase [Rhizobium terrae]